jgi:hypothetical protein
MGAGEGEGERERAIAAPVVSPKSTALLLQLLHGPRSEAVSPSPLR